MKRVFQFLNNLTYLLASVFLTLMSLSIMGWAVYEVLHALQAFTPESTFIVPMLRSVGAVVISVAILDVAKYMIEEEVYRSKELRNPKEVRQTIAKIMTIVSVVVSIEGLVYIFKAGTKDLVLLIYPASLIITSVIVIIGLGYYQKLSVEIEMRTQPKA